MNNPHVQDLIDQGFLRVGERKRTYTLDDPPCRWLVDRATGDELTAQQRAAHGVMLAMGYEWIGG